MAEFLIDKSSVSPNRRAQFRREIDAENDHLARLVALIPEAILCFDRNWVMTYANAAAIRISHLLPSDIHTKTHWELFPETIGTNLEHTYRTVMQTHIPQHIEHFYEPFDVWIDVHIFPTDEGVVLYYRDITDRRGAEFLRETSSRRLLQVLETTTDAVVSLNHEWRFTYLNRRAAQLLRPKGNLLGENLWQEFPAAAQPGSDYRYHYHRAMEQGIAGEFEAFYPEPINRWLSIQCRPYDDGIVLFFRDTTSRRESDTVLQQQQDLLASVQRTARAATWDIDYDTGKATYGAGSYPVFGHPMADIPDARALRNILLPQYLPIIAEAVQAAVETGQMIVVECQVRAADGQILWIENRVQILSINGRPTRLRGLTIDTTARKKNEEALVASEARYRVLAETLQQRQEETERQRAELESIYQTAPVGLALFDATTFHYLRINDRQVEIIGLPKEMILGKVITDIVPLPGLKELLETAASGRPVRNQLLQGELPGRPGEQRSFNVSYSPVFSSDGTVETIAAVVLEVTHQKKAETALIQSEKLAAVGRLASSISHEINNPLEAITNLLYLIGLTDDLPDSTRQYLKTAQGELSRVCQIATQTLRFHRQAVRATHVSAADLVSAVLNLYQGRLANSHIKVDATYSTSTTILCFENDIRQVLNNLIANAIDAMRSSGGRLIVRAHQATDHSPTYQQPRPGIRITIADTGHGMSPTVRARLFEPFYTTKDLNGTGLGLWISAGIVTRHQGRLNYRSSEHPIHHGTIFSLFLPWAEVTMPDSQT
jgi:PAS domain S-box-containing protein